MARAGLGSGSRNSVGTSGQPAAQHSDLWLCCSRFSCQSHVCRRGASACPTTTWTATARRTKSSIRTIANMKVSDLAARARPALVTTAPTTGLVRFSPRHAMLVDRYRSPTTEDRWTDGRTGIVRGLTGRQRLRDGWRRAQSGGARRAHRPLFRWSDSETASRTSRPISGVESAESGGQVSTLTGSHCRRRLLGRRWPRDRGWK